MPDLLSAFALKDHEILFTEAGNQALLGVSNGHWHEHEVDINLDRCGMSVEGQFHLSSWARRYWQFTGRSDVDLIDIDEALSVTARWG